MRNNNANGVTNTMTTKMTMTADEIVDTIAAMQSVEPELDAVEMQVALAEYEYHEDNWETLESDDSHTELYSE